jgi:hypothetical protein
MTGLAFARMYVDIPTETKAKLVQLAADRGMSQKALVAHLIEEACNEAKPATKKRRSRK